MTPKKDETTENKKKEFGTGLRAQLERRRDEPDAPRPVDAHPNVELRFELTAPTPSRSQSFRTAPPRSFAGSSLRPACARMS